MIATLIQISVMRSNDWHVDVRLLSGAREGAPPRGLLVLKNGWAGFDLDRPPQRRLYGNLLWRFQFDMPLESAARVGARMRRAREALDRWRLLRTVTEIADHDVMERLAAKNDAKRSEQKPTE